MIKKRTQWQKTLNNANANTFNAPAIGQYKKEELGIAVNTKVFINKLVDDEPYLSTLTGISDRGIRIKPIIHPEKVQEEIVFELMLPGEEDILWLEGETIGRDLKSGEEWYRFKNLSNTEQQKISKFVRSEKFRNDLQNL